MKKKRVEKRSTQRNWQLVQAAAGLCPGCGQERRDINPRTGKPYKLGPLCRQNWNALQKRLMKERRAAGRDNWTLENRS